MSDDPLRILEGELGARIPPALEVLTGDELLALADLLHDAKARQARALQVGVGEALDVVPRLMRGPVRKILFG